MSKRNSNAYNLLRLLQDGRWHTTWSCTTAAGTRFGGRLHELRKAWGIRVELRRTGDDTFEYAWRDDDATIKRVLASVRDGTDPTPVEPKQLSLIG